MEAEHRIISFEEGWSYIETCITKIIRILEGEPGNLFDSEELLTIYTIVYNLCVQKPPHDYSQQLYERYGGVIGNYCLEKVLPSLRNKHGEDMLKALVLRWSKYKCLVKWLCRCFSYMDRYFVERRCIPTLNEFGLSRFRHLVYKEMKFKATKAVITLIHKEREGEQIDRALLRNVSEMFVELAMGKMDIYIEDFEIFVLQDTIAYYSGKASSWIQEVSIPEYMLKYEECQTEERERVAHYLPFSTGPKLFKALEEVFEYFHNKVVHESSGEATKPSTEDLMGRMKI